MAEFLVEAIEPAIATFGFTHTFVGVVVIAIVGNAAEHSTAVLMAMKNKMDLAFNIAFESSKQIALFVAPVLVLLVACRSATRSPSSSATWKWSAWAVGVGAATLIAPRRRVQLARGRDAAGRLRHPRAWRSSSSPEPSRRAPAEQLKADGVLLASPPSGALTFVAVKDALGDADPVHLPRAALRRSPPSPASPSRRRALDRGSMRVAGRVLGGLLFVGYAVADLGRCQTTPSRSAFITGLTVVLVPFVSLLGGPPLARPASPSLGSHPRRRRPLGDDRLLARRGVRRAASCSRSAAPSPTPSTSPSPSASPPAALPSASSRRSCCRWRAICLARAAAGADAAQRELVARALGGARSRRARERPRDRRSRCGPSRAPPRCGRPSSSPPSRVFAAALSLALGRERYSSALGTGGAMIILGVLVGEVGGAWWARRRARQRAVAVTTPPG